MNMMNNVLGKNTKNMNMFFRKINEKKKKIILIYF